VQREKPVRFAPNRELREGTRSAGAGKVLGTRKKKTLKLAKKDGTLQVGRRKTHVRVATQTATGNSQGKSVWVTRKVSSNDRNAPPHSGAKPG